MSQINILGLQFDLASTYHAGHCCTPAEAEVLNRMLARGASKGLYKALLAAGAQGPTGPAMTADQKAALQTRGAEYIAEFALGFAQGHETTRSIRTESDRIARQLLEARQNKAGQTLDDLTPAELSLQLAELASSDRVKTEAERRVKVTQQIAEAAHDELLATLGEDSK